MTIAPIDQLTVPHVRTKVLVLLAALPVSRIRDLRSGNNCYSLEAFHRPSNKLKI